MSTAELDTLLASLADSVHGTFLVAALDARGVVCGVMNRASAEVDVHAVLTQATLAKRAALDFAATLEQPTTCACAHIKGERTLVSWYDLVGNGNGSDLPGLLVCAIEIDAELVRAVDTTTVERCVQPLLAPIARLVTPPQTR